MKVYIDVFKAHKAGNSKSEYEDAHWPRAESQVCERNNLRVAVADGATDAVFSGLWARLLVSAYGRQQLVSQSSQPRLGKAARAWERVVKSRPLPWYAEEKAQAGSFAALVGLELSQQEETDEGRWSVLACGDSCFFQIRSDKLIAAFPISDPEEFSNSPLLLGTRSHSTGVEGIRNTTGDWKDGDCFYLMTDALACWFLKRCESGRVPWRDLRNVTLVRQPPFDKWISSLRERGEIKNDDCTLVSATFEHLAETP
jgi:hypothetical protein